MRIPSISTYNKKGGWGFWGEGVGEKKWRIRRCSTTKTRIMILITVHGTTQTYVCLKYQTYRGRVGGKATKLIEVQLRNISIHETEWFT